MLVSIHCRRFLCFIFILGSKQSRTLLQAAGAHFHLGARRETVRDLMLAPVAHAVNREVLAWVETWQAIRRIQSVLQNGIVKITSNFGKWETAASNDDSQYAIDCHAHVHLHLTRTAVDWLCADDGCKGLRGRVNPPTSLLEEDCRQLETARLISLEHGQLMRKVNKLEAGQAKLEAGQAKLEAGQAKLEAKVDKLDEGLQAILVMLRAQSK